MWLGVLLIPLLLRDAAAAGPFDYNIHEFTGHCDPDGTCKYILQIPSHQALQNPGVMDNRTASAILKHLERHDHQLLQLLGYFGKDNSSASTEAMDLLHEITALKEENKKLGNMVQVLIGDAASLAQNNKALQAQFDHLNTTLHGKIILAGGGTVSSNVFQNSYKHIDKVRVHYLNVTLVNKTAMSPRQYEPALGGTANYILMTSVS